LEYVDPVSIGSFIAMFLGILMISGGLYARRGGRLRNREGAAVLAGFVALLGLVALGAGFVGILRG
jgi:hypothetical membrane protein